MSWFSKYITRPARKIVRKTQRASSKIYKKAGSAILPKPPDYSAAIAAQEAAVKKADAEMKAAVEKQKKAEAKAKSEAASKEKKRRTIMSQGRGKTILTGSLGITDKAETEYKRLLGK